MKRVKPVYNVKSTIIRDSGSDRLVVEIPLSKLNFLEKKHLEHFAKDGVIDSEEAVWLLLKLDPLVIEEMIKKGWALLEEEKNGRDVGTVPTE